MKNNLTTFIAARAAALVKPQNTYPNSQYKRPS